MLTTILAAILMAAPPASPTEFDSMNEAAVKALQISYNLSPAYERGGVITKLANGKFAVGVPTTEYAGDHTDIDEDPELYNGAIVATYHTHPCLPTSHVPGMFSPDDLKSARITGHATYIADLCTGNVHRWQPGDSYDAFPFKDGMSRVSALFAPQVAYGKTVGHITVNGVAQEVVEQQPRPKGESWDQENLKKNDRGCPTAIFAAPDGDLVQCP